MLNPVGNAVALSSNSSIPCDKFKVGRKTRGADFGAGIGGGLESAGERWPYNRDKSATYLNFIGDGLCPAQHGPKSPADVCEFSLERSKA
jgi:hypothetical protein